MKSCTNYLLIVVLAIGFTSFSFVGCGGDEEPEDKVVQPPKTGDEEDVIARKEIDWAAEKQEILDLWAAFMKEYNDRKLTNTIKLWTGKPSDFFYVNISGNEPLDAKGAKGVRDTIEGLWKHFSTKNDNWKGPNMHEVWIRSHGAQLQGSAHGNNALRNPGQSWAYFIKDPGKKWKINKAESIEQRNIGIHKKIIIHEKEEGAGKGFFDNDEFKR
jgi:hypothetical protein